MQVIEKGAHLLWSALAGEKRKKKEWGEGRMKREKENEIRMEEKERGTCYYSKKALVCICFTRMDFFYYFFFHLKILSPSVSHKDNQKENK